MSSFYLETPKTPNLLQFALDPPLQTDASMGQTTTGQVAISTMKRTATSAPEGAAPPLAKRVTLQTDLQKSPPRAPEPSTSLYPHTQNDPHRRKKI